MTKRIWLGSYLLTAVGWLASADRAAALNIPLSNSDFESVSVANPDGLSGQVPNWTGSQSGAALRATFDPGPGAGAAFAGENNYLILQGQGSAVGSADATQLNVVTIQPNSLYTLQFKVAFDQRFPMPHADNDDTYNASDAEVAVARLFLSTVGNPGFAQSTAANLVSFTSPTPTLANPIQTWTRVYRTDSAPQNVGDLLNIQFLVQSTAAGGQRTLLFDNVTLDVSPSSKLPGDFNNNDRVDAGDYVMWRKGGSFPNQIDDPNSVTQQDYLDWRARYGNVPGSGAGDGLVIANVPEPASLGVLLTSVLICMARSVRQRAKQRGKLQIRPIAD